MPIVAQNGGEHATRIRSGQPGSGLHIAPNDSFHVTFSGAFSYSVGSGKARIQVQDIYNSGAATSGPLHLVLVFTPNGPFPNTGYVFTAQYDLAPLAVGQHYTNVDSGLVTFTDPGNGCWYVAVVLYEQRTDGTYIADDWGDFSLRLSSGQGCMFSFSGNPLTISPGQSSTLTWSTGGTSATIDQGIGVQAPNGSTPVSPTVTTTYTCSATGTADSTPRTAQVTITVGQAAPTVSSISPNHGPAAGGTSATINGTNLTGATSVTFGGVAATLGTNTGSTLAVTVPAHAPGSVTVQVTTPGGTASTSYTYDTPAPAISSLAPSHGPTAGGTAVTINGTNLTGATSATFGGLNATLGANNGTTLSVTTPGHVAGAVTVVVTTPGGTSSSSFTYDAPVTAPPTISSITPSSGPTAGGQIVTINGTNFGVGNVVTFDTQTAGIIQGTDTSILVRTPAHPAGKVTVTVTMPSGSATGTYTYSDGVQMRIVSVVGSTAGSFGSFFRTSMQLHDNGSAPVSGTMIFHPSGNPASPSDPSLPFSLTPGQTQSIDDLVAALKSTGVGTLDINSTGIDSLLLTSRIYNDAGAAGTTGMGIDPLSPSDALQQGDSGILLAPPNTDTFRFNIGLRTLDAGATLQIALFDANGNARTSTSKTFAANSFQQTTAADFIGLAPAANETIVVTVTAGSVVVYGSVTDNKTQDPTYLAAKSLAALRNRGQVSKLVIPVVGSAAGALGSFFRTSVQLHNTGTSPINGTLVFHPQGASASAGDPSLAYALNAGQTKSMSDLVASMNTSGIGSLDITSSDFTSLLMTARIYNDAGANGTTGMGLDPLAPSDALQPGDTGVLLAPAHADVFRYNIGVRTLDGGASLQIVVIDANGNTKSNTTRTFPANYLQQFGAADLLGTSVSNNDAILITVNSGSAFIYGSITDNRTQDPTYAIARKR